MAVKQHALRFGVRRMMAAVAIIGVALAVAKYVFVDNTPWDIFAATLSALDGHYTVYAKGYRESNFRSLRVGMSVSQVEAIMGPPLGKGEWLVPDASGVNTAGPVDVIWYYARGGKHVEHGTASHWNRTVRFRNGVVWETDSSYWAD